MIDRATVIRVHQGQIDDLTALVGVGHPRHRQLHQNASKDRRTDRRLSRLGEFVEGLCH